MLRTTTRYWRRATIVAVVTIVAAMASLAAPATSSALSPIVCVRAPCVQPKPEYRVADASFKGWTFLNLNYCAPDMACTAMYHVSIPSWRIQYYYDSTGTVKSRWIAGPAVNGDQPVYVHPIAYGAPYRWAYTAKTGWVLVNQGRFERRYG